MSLAALILLVVRYMLVILFFPFSALDKILNFKGAVAQAQSITSNNSVATSLIVIGLCVEILMPIGILTGIGDRIAAFILAGYCGVTALLWKQFWAPGDFWHRGESKGRDLFWDFLKNLALAGGFLLITIGTTTTAVQTLLDHPAISTHPWDNPP